MCMLCSYNNSHQERVKRAEQGQQELRSRLQREESAREAETVEKETLQAALHVACNRGKNLHEV